MTARRVFGSFSLLAMMHFIVVGTASACAPSRDGARASAGAHASCAPSSHSSTSSTDRATELPCCGALASCTAAPLVPRTTTVVDLAPRMAIIGAIAERVPRADSPAPELPPPKV